MLGYLLGGTSVGFLSFQAYRKRQEKKKADQINAQIQENILSPYEWSEGEDIYSLQSQLISKQMEATSDSSEQIPKKKYFQRTRDVFSKTFLQLKTNQLGLFYKSRTQNGQGQQSSFNEEQQKKYQAESLVQQTIRTSSLQNIYRSFVNKYEKKNEEKQLQQVKKQIISPNLNKNSGSPNKGKNPPSPRSATTPISQFDNNDVSNSQDYVIQSQADAQKQNMTSQQQNINIPINQFENHFNESTIGKKSILYTEYKGNSPSEALKEFLGKCEQHLPIKNAMIIRYYYGKGDPSSYVLGVEYNPIENEGVSNNYQQIDGASLAQLKKTDAFQFDYDLKRSQCQDSSSSIQLNNWIESNCNQQHLRDVLEQEIESKIHISGVRQMKYIEVFALDDNKNVTNYQVYVPYGQNESAYDLRSKSQATEIHYHNTFKQSDIQGEKMQ